MPGLLSLPDELLERVLDLLPEQTAKLLPKDALTVSSK